MIPPLLRSSYPCHLTLQQQLSFSSCWGEDITILYAGFLYLKHTIASFFSFYFLKFLNFHCSLDFLKKFLNFLAIIAIFLSSNSFSSSLSNREAFREMLFYILTSSPLSIAKSSLEEISEPIESSIDKVFKSLASSMVGLLGLHSFSKDQMIFFTFSLFENFSLGLLEYLPFRKFNIHGMQTFILFH